MNGEQAVAEEARTRAGGRRDVRWNYVAHSLEGGLFLGALTFVSATTLLPTIVRSLGGPDWLVSLMPIMMASGVLLPPIFTAHAIDRLHRYMPLLLVTGVFQRLPYLLAGLALLYGAQESPALALAAAALAPLVSGVACGISYTAWQQLLIRTVPQGRRSSLFAVRCVLCCGLGLFGGWAAKAILAAWPGTVGYGLLHLCAFGLLAGSYVFFAMIREAPGDAPPPERHPGLIANLRAMPGIIRRQRQLALYLAACVFLNGMLIMVPFLAIHARQSLGRPESWLGELVVAQMVGAVLGNVLAGWMGDRFGGKAVLMTSAVLSAGMAAGAAVAGSDLAFRAIFFALGFTSFAQMIGGMTLSLEICPPAQRGTCLAIISFVRLVAMVAATQVSAAIGNGDGRFAYAAAAACGSVLIALVLLAVLREPRLRAGPPDAMELPARPS
ncbi:MAG TPA: MFS transporter [Phycisphaerae bacterium]|nr:MFS transporter [Phycisphaerae bacterium]